MSDEPDVALSRLTQTHLKILEERLPQAFPLPPDADFADLLKALDRADKESQRRW